MPRLIIIADTFINALARLSRPDQTAVKTSVVDLQTNPDNPGLQFHRIASSKDPNFWSARVNSDIRIVIHKTAQSILLAYVGRHDAAYKWAKRRRIEAHPKTHAVQIVVARERVEQIVPRPRSNQQLYDGDEADVMPLRVESGREPVRPFRKLGGEELLSVGVPADWVDYLLEATEDQFLDIHESLPQEVSEALLTYATTGNLPAPAPIHAADPFKHPDAQRRFRVVANGAELAQALDFPWEKWIVFLHPSQRQLVDRDFNGPARVMGSAGTGKTVVALHRAVRLAEQNPHARILLTTLSDPLASALKRKVETLARNPSAVVPRITVASFLGVAMDLHRSAFARRPKIESPGLVKGLLVRAAAVAGGKPIPEQLLVSEWTNVVDAWQVSSAEEYAKAPRLGGMGRMSNEQRDRLWPIFERVQRQIAERGMVTEAGLFRAVAEHYRSETEKPFAHIIVDEAQDLGVPELRFLAAMAPRTPNPLFFAGDLGQRTFRWPVSWKALGVDVRGRSSTLKVNYRTSHQIREAADRLMPPSISDGDGEKDDRRGAVSVFNGPEPIVILAAHDKAERSAVVKFIRAAVADGVRPEEIGVFVRSERIIGRARQAVKQAGQNPFELTLFNEGLPGAVQIGVMPLAIGLEFKAVVVMGCDQGQLPLKSRIESAADEAERQEAYTTERQLFYVACTRARDRLFVSGIKPVSRFLSDMKGG